MQDEDEDMVASGGRNSEDGRTSIKKEVRGLECRD
jgi:hypothetical protein